MARPDLVLFDVVETLFSLDALGRRLQEAGAGERGLELWFARFLRDGFALAASGSYRSFRDVAASSMAPFLSRFGVPPSQEQVDHVLGAFAELDPYPDVRPALERLSTEEIRVMTLANGSAESSAHLLERAGLRNLVEATLSAEATRLWKPRPEPYRHACQTAGAAPERTALVAVHSWDVHGAGRAGLVTGWCSRLERSFPASFTDPTVRGATLVDVVDGLLSLT